MKKIISFFIVLVVLVSAFCMVAVAEEATGDFYLTLSQVNNNKLFVNGAGIDFDPINPEVKPIKDDNGNVLVPLRMVVGTVGGWIDWEEETDSVNIIYNGVNISFAMNSKEIKVGDETIEVSVAPYTIHDRTVVPIDFFTECLKGGAQFDADTNTIILSFTTKVYAAG